MRGARVSEDRLSGFGFQDRTVAGLVLVALGAVFMFGNLTGFHLANWWALFILVPGAASLWRAYGLYRAAGQLTPAAGGSLASGLGLVTVAAIFLLGLSWSLLWPLMLVVIGLGLFLNPSRAH